MTAHLCMCGSVADPADLMSFSPYQAADQKKVGEPQRTELHENRRLASGIWPLSRARTTATALWLSLALAGGVPASGRCRITFSWRGDIMP